MVNHVTSAQMRAARGLVNWSVRVLSERSGVHRNTITNFETGRSGGDEETTNALRSALEAAGVIFVAENGDGPGVRLKKVLRSPEEIAAKIERLDEKAAALKHDGTPSPANALKTMDRALVKGKAQGLRKRLAKDKAE